MDLSTVHCRTASIRGGLPTMSKRAWCSPKSRPNIRLSSKAATCSFCRPSIMRAGRPCPTRAATPDSFASSIVRPSPFPVSMGNLLGHQQVGMLFINFEKPHRVRLQGIASVDDNDPLLSEYAEAQLIVRVSVTEVFRNCPRYVHRYRKMQPSEFVPRSTCETPLAPWKRVDDIQASLSAKDRARVEREGNLLSRAEYEKYLSDVASRET